MKIFIFSILFTIISVLIDVSMSGYPSKKYDISPREKAVNKVIARNSKALAKKYHMRPFAVTVAMPGGDIQCLELKFQIPGPLSKMDTRKLLLESVHDFLVDINSDTELCAYLKNHSFNIKDIGITLFIIDTKGYRINDPDIGVASVSEGKLEYKTMDQKYDAAINMEIPFFKSKSSETYEEALDVLKSNAKLDACSAVQKRCTEPRFDRHSPQNQEENACGT